MLHGAQMFNDVELRLDVVSFFPLFLFLFPIFCCGAALACWHGAQMFNDVELTLDVVSVRPDGHQAEGKYRKKVRTTAPSPSPLFPP